MTFPAGFIKNSLNTFDFVAFLTMAINSEEDKESEEEIFHKEEG